MVEGGPVWLTEDAGATDIAVTVTLLGYTQFTVDTPVTVEFRNRPNVDLNAVLGEDYSATTANVVIPAGEWSVNAIVTLTPVDDNIDEDDEVARLTARSTALTGTDGMGIFIGDNDPAPAEVVITATPEALHETSGITPLNVTATLAGTSVRQMDTVVPVTTVSGTATAGGDFETAAITLTIPAGELSVPGTLDLTVIDDTVHESDETLEISGDVPGLTVTGAEVTIWDDDAAPTTVRLSVTPGAVSEGALFELADVTATLEGNSTLQEDLRINVRMVGRDSTRMITANSLARPLVIASGESSGTSSFIFTFPDDDVDDEDEIVEVRGRSGNPGLRIVPGEVVIRDDDTAGVSISPSSLSVGEGDQQSYTIRLDSEPTSDVSVTVELPANAGFTVNPGAITFTPLNWGRQYVYVTGTQDNDAADEPPAAITHTVSSSDTLYSGATAGSVSVTVTNDDSVGVTISESSLDIEEGAPATYTVVLDTAPAGDVTVAIEGAADTDVSLDKTSLTFTTADWDTPQTVTVTAEQDDDAVDEPAVNLTHTVSSTADTAYHGMTADSVSVTVNDDDTAGVTVSPTAITVVGGGSNGYSVVLDTEPAGDVSVAIAGLTGTDLSLDKTSLTFTASDWSTAQTVTATAVEEAGPGTMTLTHTVSSTADTAYHGMTAGSVSVTVTDDDSVGVTISETSLDIEEGDSATYTVSLDSEPTGSVTVNAPANTDVTAEPASLIFTVDDWDTPQEVTVAVAQDGDAEDDDATVTHSVSRADPAYAAVSGADVAVSVTDDDKSTVFAADASYRILTHYGSPTEIVLADYLADGGTGITFTLSSCDEWRGDYYNSAIVEDGRLALESNTLGHVHGSNTQTETVCTVTGTGGGRNQEQEFRLYTVSDRTPLPLLPGALSLVEARLSELDIRISVPQGAQEYLRLGWREIGGQPTFRVVSGVSDGTVLTITGLKQGTEYDVRASLMTFQAFDLYRVGNSGAPLSLIPDGGPDSEWVGNLASGGLGKSQAIRVTSAYRSSLSIADAREPEDVGGMIFEVRMSEANDDVVTVDWTTSSDTASNDTAETPADYEAESGTLTFPAGEIVQRLTVTINNDTVDEEEEETFTVTLSNAVHAMIGDASATGTITDDDVPTVSVSFEQATYTAAEGSNVTVKVILDAES